MFKIISLVFLPSSTNGTTICPNTQAKNLNITTSRSFQLDPHHVSNCAIYHHLTCCHLSGCHHLLDYCCRFQTGLLTSTLALLWSVFHSPARATLGKYRSDCGTSLLRTLQWLPITFKIKSKLSTMTSIPLLDPPPWILSTPTSLLSPDILSPSYCFSAILAFLVLLNLHCLCLLQEPYSG